MIENINDIIFWAVMFGIFFVWFNDYAQYNLDRTRQRLFAIRDQLFMDAVEGRIDMDSEAHQMMRAMLQGSIRFTERLSMFRLIRLILLDQRINFSEGYNTSLAEALRQVDGKQRKVIHKALEDMNMVLINHLVHSSIILLTIVELVRVVSLSKQLHEAVDKHLRSVRRTIDASALRIGTNTGFV